jgi:CRISPR-associated protein Cmr4
MASLMIGMLAETFVHPGVGQAVSAIDLPVARERTTEYPFIPGSSVKGGFKTWAKEQAGLAADAKALFGEADNAGSILLSDARLLLLPVRSLDSAYVWLTCPYLLERLQRDGDRIDAAGFAACAVSPPPPGRFLGKERLQMMTLEERELAHDDDLPSGLVGALERLAPAVKARMAEQIAIVHDDEFAWFAKYALPVSARNRLDGNKTSESLWYEETLPPDTVMYCLVADRGGKPDGKESSGTEKLKAAIAGGRRYCQFGGNETLGQGWFQLTVV